MSRIQSFDKKISVNFSSCGSISPNYSGIPRKLFCSFYQIIMCRSGIYQLTTKIAFYSCGECARILHFTNCGSISPVHFGISNRTRGYNINHVGCGMEFMVSLQTFCHCLWYGKTTVSNCLSMLYALCCLCSHHNVLTLKKIYSTKIKNNEMNPIFMFITYMVSSLYFITFVLHTTRAASTRAWTS